MSYASYVVGVIWDGLHDSRTVVPTLVLLTVLVPMLILSAAMMVMTGVHAFQSGL